MNDFRLKMIRKLIQSKTARLIVTCIISLVSGAIIGLTVPTVVRSFQTTRAYPSEIMRQSSNTPQKRELYYTKSNVVEVKSDMKEKNSLDKTEKKQPLVNLLKTRSIHIASRANVNGKYGSGNTGIYRLLK